MSARRLLLAALVVALSACDRVPAGAITSCDTKLTPGAVQTDILFVVDESGSMSEEQANLHDNLGAFVDMLVASPVRNEFQIGVTTTSVTDWNRATTWYTAGPNACTASSPPGCVATPFPAGAIVAVARDGAGAPIDGKLDWSPAPTPAFGGARLLPMSSPTLAEDFKANVLVGTKGTGKEQPFRAARLALEASAAGGVNDGFLRPGARLAIVFLTDEDDCSDSGNVVSTTESTGNTQCHTLSYKQTQLDRVADFAAYLDGPVPLQGGEERRPVVAVIAGFDRATLADTGCTSSYDDPNRFQWLLDALGPERSRKASICDPSFAPALATIADLLVPQTMPLEGTPPDPRMLVVSVTRGDGAVVPCTVATSADPAAGVVYNAPTASTRATLTFQGACRLHATDRVDVHVICAT